MAIGTPAQAAYAKFWWYSFTDAFLRWAEDPDDVRTSNLIFTIFMIYLVVSLFTTTARILRWARVVSLLTSIPSLIWLLLAPVRSGLGWLFSWYLERRERSKRTPYLNENLESSRAGSEFVTDNADRPEVLGVYAEWDALQVKHMLGTAFRVTVNSVNVVVTAAHLIDAAKVTYLRGKNVEVEIPSSAWVRTGIDMVYLPCTGKFEKLSKLPSFRIGNSVGIDVSCRAAYLDKPNLTFGLLRKAVAVETDVGFGRLIYTGSTKPGFSGAPYIQNTIIYGMHTNGGRVNTGYSMSFLAAVIKNSMGRPESSECEALTRALGTARYSDVEYKPWGLDDIMVSVGGRVFMIDDEEFRNLNREREYRKFFFDDDYVGTDYENRSEGDAKMESLAKAVNQIQQDLAQIQASLACFSEQRKIVESLQDFRVQASEKLSTLELNLSALESDNPIISLEEDIDSIVNTVTCLREDMDGLSKQNKQFESHLVSISESGKQQVEVLCHQLEKNLTSRLDTQLHDMHTAFANLRDQTTRTSIPISTSCSPPSTKPAQPDLGDSQATPPLETHWDGMELALSKFKEWRTSVPVSSPGYVAWRDEYLTKCGYSPEQQLALNRRVHNQKIKAGHKRAAQRLKEKEQQRAQDLAQSSSS